MRKVSVDDIESLPGPAAVKRKLTAELGTTGLALAYYELDKGQSSAFGYHAHERQEEVFYVLRGAVTVRTESGTVAPTADEAVRYRRRNSSRRSTRAPNGQPYSSSPRGRLGTSPSDGSARPAARRRHTRSGTSIPVEFGRRSVLSRETSPGGSPGRAGTQPARLSTVPPGSPAEAATGKRDRRPGRPGGRTGRIGSHSRRNRGD